MSNEASRRRKTVVDSRVSTPIAHAPVLSGYSERSSSVDKHSVQSNIPTHRHTLSSSPSISQYSERSDSSASQYDTGPAWNVGSYDTGSASNIGIYSLSPSSVIGQYDPELNELTTYGGNPNYRPEATNEYRTGETLYHISSHGPYVSVGFLTSDNVVYHNLQDESDPSRNSGYIRESELRRPRFSVNDMVQQTDGRTWSPVVYTVRSVEWRPSDFTFSYGIYIPSLIPPTLHRWENELNPVASPENPTAHSCYPRDIPGGRQESAA